VRGLSHGGNLGAILRDVSVRLLCRVLPACGLVSNILLFNDSGVLESSSR